MNDTVTAALRALTGDTERLLADRLRPIGITVPQMEFLAAINADPTHSGASVSKALHLTPQTGTTVLRNLAAKGLITIKHIAGTGRRNAITVTNVGKETLTAAQEAVADVEKHLTALLGSGTILKIGEATSALQPYLPRSKPNPKPGSKRKKAVRLPRRTEAEVAKAGRLRQRCLAWSQTVGGSDTVPGYVARQYGTQAQIDHLVAEGAWEPDGNGYRISD